MKRNTLLAILALCAPALADWVTATIPTGSDPHGVAVNPVTNKAEEDLTQAKFAIDLLQVMEEKTQGNRTQEEDKFLQDCLYQLRMVYIDKSAKKK